MQIADTHVLVVDYRPDMLEALGGSLAERSAHVHTAEDRVDALGKLWALASEKIIPRAIISSWLLDDPEGRQFYKLIGREVDHTSLQLFKQAAKLDEMDPEHSTIMLCHADNVEEASLELEAEGLTEKVGVISSQKGLGSIVELLVSDERTQIIRVLRDENRLDCVHNALKTCNRCGECGKMRADESNTCLQALVEMTEPELSPDRTSCTIASSSSHPTTSVYRKSARRLSR